LQDASFQVMAQYQGEKGGMIVIKGLCSTGNLYKMIWSMVIGSYSISTKENSVEDTSKLWNMHLGHMSERGLHEFHGRKLLKGIRSASWISTRLQVSLIGKLAQN